MRKAIVLHSDILGFKDLILAAEDDKDEETVKILQQALHEGISTLKYFTDINSAKTNVSYKLFSDNLYVSFSYDEDDIQSFSNAILLCFTFSRAYTAVMLDNKIVIRGGISFGNDYSDENMIFSMALVKAYLLETEKAIFPRIVIDDNLIDLMKEPGLALLGKVSKRVINNSIIADEVGVFFLNPVGLAKDFEISSDGFNSEELHKGFIKRYFLFAQEKVKEFEGDKLVKIREKYEWFEIFLMWSYANKVNARDAKFAFSSFTFEL